MKINYLRKIVLLVSCTFTALMLVQCKKDMGVSTETGEPGTVIITVGGVSDYENQISKLGSLSPTNSGNTSIAVDSDVKKVNDDTYMTTSSSVQAMESILEKPILTPSDLTDKVNAKYAATTSPMLNEKYYRIVLKKRNSEDAEISRISQAGQELRLTLDVGATYDWYAFSYNDVNSSDLEATDLTAINIKENSDLLWAKNEVTIENTDVIKRINFTFAHKVAKLSFEVDASTLAGDIDEFEAKLVSIGNLTTDSELKNLFRTGTLNLTTGNVTPNTADNRPFTRVLTYIKSNPTSRIAKVDGFYTINWSEIGTNKNVVIQITKATRKKWYKPDAATNILNVSEMNKNITFSFVKYPLAAGVNHISKIAFNTILPGFNWTIVDTVDFNADNVMSVPAPIGLARPNDYRLTSISSQALRYGSWFGSIKFHDVMIQNEYYYNQRNTPILNYDLSKRLFQKDLNLSMVYTNYRLNYYQYGRSDDYNWGASADGTFNLPPFTFDYIFKQNPGEYYPDLISMSTHRLTMLKEEVIQLAEYVRDGGVLILFLDKGAKRGVPQHHITGYEEAAAYNGIDYAFTPFFKILFGQSAEVRRFADTPKDSRFLWPETVENIDGSGREGAVYDKSDFYTNVYKLNDHVKDEITDGYYGKTEGLYWGGTGQNSYVTGIPDSEIIDYSYAVASNHDLDKNVPHDARVMFRAKRYNLFVVCDATWLRSHPFENLTVDKYFSWSHQWFDFNPFANSCFAANGHPQVGNQKDPISGNSYGFANGILYGNVYLWATNIIREQKDGAPRIRPVQ